MQGKTFLPVAQQCVLQLLTVQHELKNKGPAGKSFVRFAAPQHASAQHLTTLLNTLPSKGLDIRTQTMSENLQTCCQLFQERQCDFLVCYAHPEFFPPFDPSAYKQIKLTTETFIPVCSPTGRNGFGWLLPGKAQDIIPYLAYPPECALGLILGAKTGTQQSFLQVDHVNALSEALKALAISGAGVAWLPQALITTELAERDLIPAGGQRWHILIDLILYYNPALPNPEAEHLWQHIESIFKPD